MPALEGVGDVVLAFVRVRAAVPHDHPARAVLAFGDDAFELLVLPRVVFGATGHPFVLGVGRWPFGHRPGREHAVDLEPKIVVIGAGRVVLNHEARCFALSPPQGTTGRLRAASGASLTPVFLQRHTTAYPAMHRHSRNPDS